MLMAQRIVDVSRGEAYERKAHSRSLVFVRHQTKKLEISSRLLQKPAGVLKIARSFLIFALTKIPFLLRLKSIQARTFSSAAVD